MCKKLSFDQKLEMISKIYFGKYEQSFSEYEINKIENDLGITIPLSLRKFYLTLGGNVDLLKCMYNITLPKELKIEEEILMLAVEYQNVCSYGININTQELIYIDLSNNIIEPTNQSLEDFLLYILAIQGTEFLPCVGKV